MEFGTLCHYLGCRGYEGRFRYFLGCTHLFFCFVLVLVSLVSQDIFTTSTRELKPGDMTSLWSARLCSVLIKRFMRECLRNQQARDSLHRRWPREIGVTLNLVAGQMRLGASLFGLTSLRRTPGDHLACRAFASAG